MIFTFIDFQAITWYADNCFVYNITVLKTENVGKKTFDKLSVADNLVETGSFHISFISKDELFGVYSTVEKSRIYNGPSHLNLHCLIK